MVEEQRKLTDVVDRNPMWFALFDSDERLSFCNQGYVNNLPQDFQDYIAENGTSAVRLGDIMRARLSRRFSGTELEEVVQYRLQRHRDASNEPIEISEGDDGFLNVYAFPLISGGSAIVGLPVTDLKMREEELHHQQLLAQAAAARLKGAIDGLPLSFVIYDKDEKLVLCNDAYRANYGAMAHRVQPGVSLTELFYMRIEAGLAPQAEGREDAYIAEELLRHRTGPEVEETRTADGRYLRMTRTRMENGDTVGTRVDITELRRAQAELESKAKALERASATLSKQALTDPLTRLQNRRAWTMKLEEIVQACRSNDHVLAIMHADLDGFKVINDTHGHAAGDTVLLNVAIRLQTTLGPNDLVARVGGDEFMVARVCENNGSSALALADEILAEMAKPIDVQGKACQVGASIGIATARGGAINPATLTVDADAALYRAKQRGRNQRCLFTEDMRKAARRKRMLSFDLSEALRRRQIVPYFQPKVSAETLETVGYEALARWIHPDLGTLAPVEFLEFAESQKRVPEIDRLMLEQVLDIQADWRRSKQCAVPVAVNVSSRRLGDPDLLSSLQSLRIEPGSLTFELLETTFLDEIGEQLRYNLDGLREMGIGIDVDDFGTGHASLLSLLMVRPDRLKIDRSLVATIDQNHENMKLISLIVGMTKVLGIRVVAEGVETLKMAKRLRTLGCDELQGYAFGRPVSADELTGIADPGARDRA